MIALIAAERMDHQLVATLLDPGEARIDFRVRGPRRRRDVSIPRKAGSSTRERFSSVRTTVRQRLLHKSSSDESSLGAVK